MPNQDIQLLILRYLEKTCCHDVDFHILDNIKFPTERHRQCAFINACVFLRDSELIKGDIVDSGELIRAAVTDSGRQYLTKHFPFMKKALLFIVASIWKSFTFLLGTLVGAIVTMLLARYFK